MERARHELAAQLPGSREELERDFSDESYAIISHFTPMGSSDDLVLALLAAGHFRIGDFGVVTSVGVEPVDSPDGHDDEWLVQAIAPIVAKMQGMFREVHAPLTFGPPR